MVALPGNYGVRAHLPDGGKIWIKGLLFAREGEKVKIQEGQGSLRHYQIEGDYVEIFFYTPHEAGFEASPFGVGWLFGRDERDRYQEYFL